MSRFPSWLLSIFVVGALLCGVTPARATGTLPAPGEYVVDSSASIVRFQVTELLVNNVTGRFKTCAGAITVGDSLAKSRIEAAVDVGSVDTGSSMRNEHLLRAGYFDATKFPQMKFASTAIWGTPDNFGIKGNLTIKGVTKEVVFSARIQDGGVVLAETKIDRTDFGVSAGGTIKNEVHLHLEIHMSVKAKAN